MCLLMMQRNSHDPDEASSCTCNQPLNDNQDNHCSNGRVLLRGMPCLQDTPSSMR